MECKKRKMQKIKVKREYKKKPVNQKRKGKEKIKKEKRWYEKVIGWLVVGSRCFLRLCQCFF